MPRGEDLQPFALDVERGISITIMMSFAARTRPATIRQSECRINRAAHIARLAGRIEAADYRQMATVPQSFVFKLPPELTKRGICHRFSQLGSRKAVDAQVLDTDALVFIYQICRQFVQEVFALAGGLRLNQRNFVPGPKSARASFFAPAEFSLLPAELPLRLAEELRYRNAFAV